MSDWETLRRQIAISGRVLDSRTGTAVANACVQITAAPESFATQVRHLAKQPGSTLPDRAMTKSDGAFFFLDLPDGEYTLTTWMPERRHQYDPVQRDSAVSHDTNGRIQQSRLHITLPSYTGKVILPRENLTTPQSVFLPTAIAGSQLWLHTAALSVLAQDDSVPSWTDNSGHNHHATQTAVLNQPRYHPQGLNGRPALQFNGENQFLVLPLAETATEHTFFFVVDNAPGGGHSHYLLDAQSGRLALNLADTASPANIRFSDGTWRTLAPTAAGPQILTWRFAGETAELFRNGQQIGTAVYIPRPLGGRVIIGASYQGRSSFFAGAIAEIIYYNRPLFGDERRAVEEYLHGRYAI